MSMHEFEHLVEASIRLLAESGRPTAELRSYYWNLYEFQAQWDTGFTELRVRDLLLAAHYTYPFAREQHPDYAPHRAYFDGLSTFTFVTVPGVGADGSYFDPPLIYANAGSALWKRLVRDGVLAGEDAVAPRRMDLIEVARDVALLAERSHDVDLVSMWYRLLLPSVMGTDLVALRTNVALRELREVVARTDALSIEFPMGFLEDPPEEEIENDPMLEWWFDLEELA